MISDSKPVEIRGLFFRRIFCSAVPAATLLFVAGCANSYEVKVDALAKPKAEDAISIRSTTRTA